MAELDQKPGHALPSDHLRKDIAKPKWDLYLILCLRQDLCDNLELNNPPASASCPTVPCFWMVLFCLPFFH